MTSYYHLKDCDLYLIAAIPRNNEMLSIFFEVKRTIDEEL